MVVRCLADLLLGRTHVDDDLLRQAALLEAVQDVAHGLDSLAHGDGDDDDVGLCDAVLVRDDIVHQPDLLRRRGVHRLLFHAQHPGREPAPPEVDRHGPPDETQAYDSDGFHNCKNAFTFSSAFSSFGTGAQREMRI